MTAMDNLLFITWNPDLFASVSYTHLRAHET